MLRAGVGIFSLQKLIRHADLQVLRRYLAHTTDPKLRVKNPSKVTYFFISQNCSFQLWVRFQKFPASKG